MIKCDQQKSTNTYILRRREYSTAPIFLSLSQTRGGGQSPEAPTCLLVSHLSPSITSPLCITRRRNRNFRGPKGEQILELIILQDMESWRPVLSFDQVLWWVFYLLVATKQEHADL